MSNSSDRSPGQALQVLRGHGFPVAELEPLAGDVSVRSYFRVRLEDGSSAVLALYPSEIASMCDRFARATELMRAAGVRCPAIFGAFCDSGLMLLEDLGERTLYDLHEAPWSTLSPWLHRAARLLPAIASIPQEAVTDLNPPLDRALLGAELRRTWDLLLADDGIRPGALPAALAAGFDEMLDRLADAPTVPCHRDFMARNLVPLEDPNGLAVIDHQDLRLGPHTYDLASLLNDSLYPPLDVEMEVVTATIEPSAQPDYHRAAAQRTLKAVGTFLGFARKGNARHLVLVEPTLERARRHLDDVPEIRPVLDSVDELWAELLAVLSADGAADRIW